MRYSTKTSKPALDSSEIYPGSMANFLRIFGAVPHGTWGTNQDICDILSDYIFFDYQDIDRKGAYILFPSTLTSKSFGDDIDYAVHIQNAAEQAKTIAGQVDIIIPVTRNNSHWQLAKHTFMNGELTTATLWNPAKDSNPVANQTAYNNIQQATDKISSRRKVNVEYVEANIQNNGHSCMDFCVQKALSDIGKNEHPIVEAGNDAKKLRSIIESTIIVNKKIEPPQKSVQINQTVTEINPFAEPTEIENAIHAALMNDQKTVEGFDAIFANELQRLYNKNLDGNESEQVQQARNSALKQYSLFAHSPNHLENQQNCLQANADLDELNNLDTPILVS